jgi:hypothetical protein
VFAYSTKATVLPTSRAMLQQFITATKGFRATMPFGNVHPLFGKAPRRQAPAESASPKAPTTSAIAQEPARAAEVRP